MALEPGHRYAFPIRATNPEISFVVPSGWTGDETWAHKDYGDAGPAAPFIWDGPFDHGYKDPCTDHTPVAPAAGSGAAGLLGVIADQPGIDARPIKDVTVGGHVGRYVDYTVTVDPASCKGDVDGGGFWIWGTCPAPVYLGCEMVGTGDRRYGVSKNGRERVYAIDVDGNTVTFFTPQPADLLATDRQEFQQVLDSIEFETAAPAVLPEGDPAALEPGRYAFPVRGGNPPISFTLPSGWAGSSTLVGKDEGSGPCYPVSCKGTNPHGDSEAAPFLFDQPFDHGFKDPCADYTPVVPVDGSGATGLLAVIAGQPGIDAGPIKNVTMGGHAGKYVDYTVTVDPATCGNGEDGFWIWGWCPAPVWLGCEGVAGDRRYGVSKNGRERAYAIDVDGKTYTFMTNQPGDLLAADRAELQQVLHSLAFEPAG